MSKASKVQKEKKNIESALKGPEKKKQKRRLQKKLSQFIRTSPLAEIDLSRDNRPL